MMQTLLTTFVVLVGLLQITGYVMGIDSLRLMGSTTAAAPLPLVFTGRYGYEPFAAQFTIQIVLENGDVFERQLNSKIYSRLNGPSDRRGPYGVALYLSPFLPHKIFSSVLVGYGLCRNGPLANVLDLPGLPSKVRIIITMKPESIMTRVWIREGTCNI